jgi:cytochrome c556
MSSQPGAGDRSPANGSAGPFVASAYTPAQWRQLTRLPGQVVIASIEASAAGGGAADRVAEAVAGLGGIASGRSFDSELVRAVAAAIYAETDRDLTLVQPDGPPVDVLANCRAVAQLLASRADPADAAAYRQWVQSIAAQAVRPVDGRGLVGRRFLVELGRALGLS